MKKNEKYLEGIAFALLNSFSLGIVGLIDKIGTSQLKSPLIFSAQSIFFALLFTLLFALIYFNRSFLKNLKNTSFFSWKLIFLIGVLGSGLSIMFRFLGLIQSTGTFATLSQIVTTALTAILASLFLKERLTKSFWVLFVIIILAMYVVSTGKIDLVTMKTGDVLILTGTLFLAGSNIFSKIAIQYTLPTVLSLGRFLFGGIFLLLTAFLLVNQFSDIFTFTPWVIISGLLWSISVVTFNLAIKRVGVIFVTSLLMVAPIYTMVLESVFLQHNFNSVQITAALIAILSGILIIIPKDKLPQLIRNKKTV